MRQAYMVNTNSVYDPSCESDMLQQQKCAAYGSPWKRRITAIQEGDYVFLYTSKRGIVARGVASGIMETADYRGVPEEEFFMKLHSFQVLTIPVTAAEIRRLVREIDEQLYIQFQQTVIKLPAPVIEPLWQGCGKRIPQS